MKKILLLLITICCIQVVHSQSIDQATQTKIKVKFMGAEKLYEQGEYLETLEKIQEIETLFKGRESATLQNLKVKLYLDIGMFQRSKEELDKLYNMNPDDKIIEDIASYEYKIDKGIKDEIARKERARLAEIKKKERERVKEIERIAKKEKISEALNHFEWQTCPDCSGSGKETYIHYSRCSKPYSGSMRSGMSIKACNGKGYQIKTFYDRNYYVTGEKEITCNRCGGSGKEETKRLRKCSNCDGSNYVLVYSGSDYFSASEIESIIENNRQEIMENISRSTVFGNTNPSEKDILNELDKCRNEINKYINGNQSNKTGCVSGDCVNGFGTYIWGTGAIYSGYWIENSINGVGIYVWANKRRYEGEWVDVKMNGFGIEIDKDGNIRRGVWSNNNFIDN